jgi:hypothetical protein
MGVILRKAAAVGAPREPRWAPGEVKVGGEGRNYRDDLISTTTTCAQDRVVIDFIPGPLPAMPLLSWRR